MMRVHFEGGKANNICMSTSSNCKIIFYGNKGQEEKYIRTNRTDNKGRVIFVVAGGVCID